MKTRFAYLLPFLCLLLAAPALRGEEAPPTPEAAAALLRSRYYSDREAGARMLRALPDSALPALERMLDDPCPTVAEAAAVELARRGVPSAAGPLMKLLFRSPAVYGPVVLPLLARFGERGYDRRLLDLLSPSSPVRDEAAACVAAFRGKARKRILSDLADMLRAREIETRLAAEKGLAALDGEAVPLLVGALGEPFPVCLSAASALSETGAEAVEAVLEAALSGRGSAALYASLALSQMECPEAAAALKRLFEESDRPLVRANAVNGFALHPKEFRAELASAALRDASPAVRTAALRALASRDEPPEGLDPSLLTSALGDTSPEVRFAAVSACAKFKPPGAAAAWGALLSDPDTRVRLNAAWTAGLFGDRALVAGLGRLLSAPDGLLRLAAARSLLLLGEEAGEDLLAAELRSRTERRRYAVFALSAARDRRAVDALVEALPRLDATEREIARYTLFAVTGAPLPLAEWDRWWRANRRFWTYSARPGVAAWFKGRYYEEAGLAQVAEEYYRAAVQAAPTFPDAHLSLARLLAAKGDAENLERALAEARKAAALKDDARCRLLAARILKAMGRTAEAADEAARGLSLSPDDPDLRALAAELAEELKR